MPETENEPYTRWQGFRINQMTLCIALFLSFAVAILGFSLRLLTAPAAEFMITSCYARIFFLSSLITGLLSLLWGSIACLTRLADFRITAQVAKHPSASESDRLREKYQLYGGWTWGLFRTQLIFFALQVIGLAISLTAAYHQRLF